MIVAVNVMAGLAKLDTITNALTPRKLGYWVYNGRTRSLNFFTRIFLDKNPRLKYADVANRVVVANEFIGFSFCILSLKIYFIVKDDFNIWKWNERNFIWIIFENATIKYTI